jgi:hypothetical protein
VNFVALLATGEQQLIQACVDPTDSSTFEREIRALQEASRLHPEASLHLIVLEAVPAFEAPAPIQVHTLAEWLLERSA